MGLLNGCPKSALHEKTLPQKNVLHTIAIITIGE